MIIIGVGSVFLVKDTPEEMGFTPDNEVITKDEVLANLAVQQEYVSGWTVPRLLRDRDVWLMGIGYGLLFMVTVGLVSQFVPRLISIGYALPKAIEMLSISALIGVFGSYVWGWLDQTITTRKASMIYALWYIGALILNIIPASSLTIWLSVIMIGFGIGGIGNLAPSMVTSVFGRYDFAQAYTIVNPLNGIIRVSAFAVLGFGVKLTGSYEGAYMIFIALDALAFVLIWQIDDTCKSQM